MIDQNKKGVIYPYRESVYPFFKYIVACHMAKLGNITAAAPAGWGIAGWDLAELAGEKKCGTIITDNFDEAIQEADYIIVPDLTVEEGYKKVLLKRLEQALKLGIEVICMMHISEVEQNVLEQAGREGETAFRCWKRPESAADNQQELRSIDIPIIVISDLIGEVPASEVELSVLKKFRADGYKSTLISEHAWASLLEAHPFPAFMLDTGENEQDKIYKFNHYVSELVMKEESDVCIISIPEGISKYNEFYTNGFGLMNYLVSQAVSADFVILYVPFSDGTEEYYKLIDESYTHKFGTPISCVCMGNIEIDPINLLSERKMGFLTADNQRVKEMVKTCDDCEIPIFHVLDEEGESALFSYLMQTLIDYAESSVVD